MSLSNHRLAGLEALLASPQGSHLVKTAGEKTFWNALGKGGKGTAGYLAGSPFRGISGGLADILLGTKDHGGSRMRSVKGLKGMRPISKTEWKKARGGGHSWLSKGDVGKARINGKITYFRRIKRPGGAIGLVRRYPLHAAAIGGLGYLALKTRKSAKERAELAEAERAGTPFKKPTEEVANTWKEQLSYKNPMESKVWG